MGGELLRHILVQFTYLTYKNDTLEFGLEINVNIWIIWTENFEKK